MAASNQHRLAVPHSAPMVETAAYHEVPAAPPSGYGLGADSLGFDLDIVLKDADGSLMDAELDTVYDFNLGGGCGIIRYIIFMLLNL
uniref:Uncharacterized protein n=1 Tax=Heterorhabditis bacteriophora TaxID=37862 RepID=A0A1I7XCW3_HETBA